MVSVEAKVGAMTLTGILALVLVFFTLNNFQWSQDGYPVKAIFPQVGGLKVGAPVRAAGVDVGKVSALKLTQQGVLVTLQLAPGVQIPQGSQFTIRSTGLMGDKFVEITPNQESPQYLSPGQTVQGENLMDMEEVVAQAGATMEEVKSLAKSINEIVGQEEVKKSARDSILNLAKVMENLNSLTAVLNQMALDNQGDVRSMISSLRVMSENMQVASQDVRALAQGVEANGATAEKIQSILDNLEYSSKRATQIADDIQSYTGDKDLKKDIKSTVAQARDAVEKTNQLLSSFGKTKTTFSYEGQYGSETSGLRSTVNLRIDPNDKQFFILGLTNKDDENKTNVQLGSKLNKNTALKAGLFQGYMGVALSKDFNRHWSLESQLTSKKNAHFNLRSEISFKPDLALTVQGDNLLGKGKKETYLGLQQKF